ncbi:YniB family protein [Xenorhabdus japonica]|uniref:YniB-like protein n=1 Tax=Xenorhabdus japonica TaxID=53341 RepID=A0A1I4YXR1_9GAMM|nr:YniB-like protein [Xenorhabdus japonica]
MTYQQAGYVALAKRILGWIIFVSAFLSTFASVINLAWQHGVKGGGVKCDSINAVLNDFLKMMTEMIKFNTPFLDFFGSILQPLIILLELQGGNISFLVIYILMFVGLAMNASDLRMYRQFRFIKERIEDQMILEHAKESERTKEQLEAKIKFPRHSLIQSDFYPLYITNHYWYNCLIFYVTFWNDNVIK